jgi:SPP1 gp7 family putative phage head morphogenesis protein
MYKRYRADAIDQGVLNSAKIRTNRRGLRKKPPRWLDPRAIERKYQAELVRLVDAFFRDVDAELLGALPDIVNQHGIETKLDSWVDGIERAITRISLRAGVLTDQARQLSLNIGLETSNFNQQQLKRIMRSTLGVDVLKAEPWLRGEIDSFVAENVSLIKSIPDQALTTIEGMAQRGVRSGASAADIAKEIQERLGVTKSRARLIASDQVGKLNGDLTKKRQTALGIETYYWQTSRDERVRESHKVMNGLLCRWDDPTLISKDNGGTWIKRSSIGGDNGSPGYPVRCRCSADPNLEQVFQQIGI